MLFRCKRVDPTEAVPSTTLMGGLEGTKLGGIVGWSSRCHSSVVVPALDPTGVGVMVTSVTSVV